MTPEERAQFAEEIVKIIQNSSKPQLTDEEMQWVRLAIEAESRKIKFRDAVIEKSLSGLIWSAIVGFGYILLDFLKNHGLKV